MMRWIVASSLKFRLLAIPIVAALAFVGFARLPDTPVDVLPEFDPPRVQIQTEALGLSAAEVEQLVTVPLEQDLLNGVAWLEEIRSTSIAGLSSIDLIFEPGTDLLRARQMVAGADDPGARAAQRVQAAGDGAAGVVDQPGHDGVAVVRGRVDDRHVGAGPLAGQAAVDGRARRGQRVDLGSARAPAAGPDRSRSGWPSRASRSARSSRPPATRCGFRR